jgi:hypothetical protein
VNPHLLCLNHHLYLPLISLVCLCLTSAISLSLWSSTSIWLHFPHSVYSSNLISPVYATTQVCSYPIPSLIPRPAPQLLSLAVQRCEKKAAEWSLGTGLSHTISASFWKSSQVHVSLLLLGWIDFTRKEADSVCFVLQPTLNYSRVMYWSYVAYTTYSFYTRDKCGQINVLFTCIIYVHRKLQP